MENNNIIKPITIIREEFMIDLKNLINDSELPAFILEPILRDTYNKVKIAEQQQLENDKKLYQDMINKAETN
jgi:hypothetical protein